MDPLDSAKEFEERWVIASAVMDPPDLSRLEEHQWVAARALSDRQAVVEACDHKAAKATPIGQAKIDPVQCAQDVVQE